MKQDLHKGYCMLIAFILSAAACKKSAVDSASTDPAVNPTTPHDTTLAVIPAPFVPYPATPVAECNFAPNYGDSIVYPQPSSSGDYYVYPQNNQGLQGTYLSWPAGLQMDPKTGSIDLTGSETGQRYSVAFVKAGGSDTCMSDLIVAGAAYMDSVYVLSQSQATATPYFNANPAAPSPCASSQGQGCVFDYNNYAHNQGIEIDQKTGFIDLQKTMQKSIFGLLPINGTTVNTTIYYKLSDNSNNAPQKIQLQLVFYNHKSDIPPNVLSSITNSIVNTLDNLLLSKGPSPRPPLIIIVRNN
jgi:hypothetical protein